jgi:hypothetical protein
MARMIPPVIGEDSPPGEHELFKLLRSDPATDAWTVLHSLDLPNHQKQLEGEIDFVVVVPGMGVACIEVKSHKSVRRRADGMWLLGNDPPWHKGPFKQASEGTHSLRNLLTGRRQELAGVLFWSAVCFPNVEFRIPAAEWHAWQVIDSVALSGRPISRLVSALLSNAADHVKKSPSGAWLRRDRSEPTIEQSELIVKALRPEFEVYQSPKARRRERTEELRKFTEDQYDALDSIEANRRVLFEGAAGTGKTLLAVEAARRAKLEDRRTLICCYNRLLGKWLEREAQPLAPTVSAGTLHKLMLSISGLSPPAGAGKAFWDRELPEAAANSLLSKSEAPMFELLVVDEAQDVLLPAYLDVLDLMIEGGLASGSWAMFGDFDRQALYGSDALSPAGFIEERSPLTFRHPLRANCRNTPRIAELVRLLAPMDTGWRRVLRPDNGIEASYRFWSDPAQEPDLLADALDGLKAEGFDGAEIAVLSATADQAARRVTRPPWAQRLRLAADAAGGDVRFSTVHSFKGLEAPAVVVTGLDAVSDPAAEAVLYTALTRATEQIVLVGSTGFQDFVMSRLFPKGPIAP